MMRRVAIAILRLGRVTIFTVGLAVLIGVAVGLATQALAGNGDPLKLGRSNVATAITRLAGSQGVDGAMLRIENNDGGNDDTALDLRVDGGEPPMQVNSDKKVNKLNADLVDGFTAGCAAGQRLIAGWCFDEEPQETENVATAADACHDLGGQLPGALQLRAIANEPGIDLGSGDAGHWSADIEHIGNADPPNDLVAVVVFDSGGLQLFDDQEQRPFRCIHQPLAPA